jgi:nucleoside-diphosphate-sugar epimerase
MIIVLGATGLVGQAVLKELDERNMTFVGASRQDGPPYEQRYLKWPFSDYHPGSLLRGVTCVVHLANSVTPGGVSDLAKVQGFAENAVTNAIVIDLCVRYEIPKLVWVGSATGYGDGTSGLEEHFGEGHVQDGVIGPATAARSFELQLQALAKMSPIDVRVIRPTTVIGPSDPLRKPPLHAATKLIWSMLCGEESTIYVPEVGKDYLFSSDLARILVEETRLPPQAHTFEAYNVGSGQVRTLAEVASVVGSVLGDKRGPVIRVPSSSSPAVRELPLRKGQARYSAPRVPFEQGIAEILSSYMRVVPNT